MAERLTFTLEGRDHLSRVLGHAGDSAERLRRTMEDASDGSGNAILTLTRDAEGRLRDMEGRFLSASDAAAILGHELGESSRPVTDWGRAAEEASRMGDELKSSFLSLLPAVIPMAAALAPVAASAAAAGVAMGALGLAAGRQFTGMSEAAKAEEKYTDAVAENGARSQEAAKAQIAYARQMEKLPPATRQAATALSVLKDQYEAWSDSLSQNTMTPVTKGMAALGAILPKLTPMVKGAATEFDRLITLAGGGVSSPGFDAFAKRLSAFSTDTLHRANDALVHFLRTLDTGKLSGGVSEFMDFARAQGPIVADTLRNVASALMNVLRAGTDVGVGMLTVVNALSQVAASLPPELITAMLQLAIAIKAVNLAAVGMGAGRAAVAAFGTQVVAMQTAAAGATTRMGALTASFGALSRGAKLALIGSGIGLVVVALSELAAMSAKAPPDVDKLTGSLKQLGATGKVTGEAARAFGSDLEGLYGKVRSLTDPSTVDDIQQFIVTLGGLGTWDSTPVKAAKENIDAIDKALAGLVSSGRADLAAAAASRLAAEYGKGGRSTEEFTRELDDYSSALDDSRFEQELAAQAMGLFGQQAQATKQKLDAQKASADSLRQAIAALNDTNRAGLSAQIAFEQALDESTEAAKKNTDVWRKNGGVVDLTTEKGRTAATALNNLAARTDEAAAAARESGASWQTVNGVYERGRQQLIKNAMQMGLNKDQARRLADQILKTPDKTARLKGNLEDLEAKLRDARGRLARVPDSRKAQIRAEISQLEEQIRRAKGSIASVKGKTVSIMVDYRTRNSGASDFTKSIGGYAGGGTPRAGEWAWVGEAGPELIHFKTGNARVYDHQTSMRLGAPTAGRAVSTGGGPGAGGGTVVNISVQGAIDPTATAQQIQRILLNYQRGRGGDGLGF